jgi:pimeloyl-ACP methyl ester carboxylesterase
VTTFVLIPGAGTDPRIYAATIEALRELGHDGVAPPLPLDDPAATPSDHAEAVVAAVAEDRETVVVAHSLGAFVGPLVAARLRARQLVLLSPMIPKPGETAGEWGDDTQQEEAIGELLDRFGPPDGWGEEAMAEVFFHDVDPAVAQANERYEGAPVPGMFGEPWPLDAWPDVPTRVLVPRDDRLFPLEFQRRVARERLGLEVDEMEGGHMPMLSRPRELAQRLVELAP